MLFDLWSRYPYADRPSGRVSAPWRAEIEKDPALRQARIVLELVTGDGGRYRIATEEVEVVDADGTTRVIRSGLIDEPEIDNTTDLGNAASRARGFDLEISESAIDIRRHLRSGLPVAGFAELSMVAPGMDWIDRRVIVRGLARNGGTELPASRLNRELPWGSHRVSTSTGTMRIGIQDPRSVLDVVIPPREHRCTLAKWPDASEGDVGRPYPLVLGRGVVQALRVDNSTPDEPLFLCASGVWEVQSIWRNDEEASIGASAATFDFDVYYRTTDDEGVVVTLIRSHPGRFTWEDSDSVIVELVPASDDTGDPRLLDAIADLVTVYGPLGRESLNQALFAAASARLPPLRIRGTLTEEGTLIRWIEEELLGSFPMVSMAFRAGRYGPIVTDWRAPVLHTLEAGGGLLLEATAPITEDAEDMRSDFGISYAWDYRLDGFGKSQRVGPNDDAQTRAAAQLMAPADPELQSVVIYDDATALASLSWSVDHRALPTIYTEYAALPSAFMVLQEGDVTILTDADRDWYEVRATIERLGYRRGTGTVGLRLWESPFRLGGDRAWAEAPVTPPDPEEEATDFPAGAWGIWNPMAAVPAGVDEIVPGVSYGLLLDQSGNLRHADSTNNSIDPGATTEDYIGPYGARAVPTPTSVYHRYALSSAGSIGDFTFVAAMPLDMGTWGNGKRPASIFAPPQNISLRRSSTGEWGIIMGGTVIWSPIVDTSGTPFAGLTTNSYVLTMIRREIDVLGGGTEATWRCVIVRDPGDGSGPTLITDSTLAGETASLLLNNELFLGFQYDNNPGRAGPVALYKTALADVDANAAIVAAGWYMGASRAALEALF